MRVNSSNNVGASKGTKIQKKKGAGSKFSPFEAEEVASPASTSQSAPISDIDAILALQSVDGVDSRQQKKREVVRHANEVLDILDEMKVALLSGGRSQSAIARLRRLLDQYPSFEEDRGLTELLDHIRLRAEVEIAKANVR